MDYLLKYLNKARGDPTVEIECRIPVDKRVYNQTTIPHPPKDFAIYLINKVCSENRELSIHQSINLIHADQICQINFDRGQKTGMTYYQKKPILGTVFLKTKLLMKLTASLETKIEPFNLSEAKLARCKLRFSANCGNWRLDITIVKNADLTLPAVLTEYKAKMFTPIEPQHFAAEANFDFADIIEFETEWIGKTDIVADDFIMLDSLFLWDRPMTTVEDAVFKIAGMLFTNPDTYKNRGIRSIGNNPVGLDKNKFNEILPNITTYYISPKVDGKRTMLLGDTTGVYAVNDQIKQISPQSVDNFILDCEEYNGTYYIFDVLYLNADYCTKSFEERMKLFPQFQQFVKLKPFVRVEEDYKKTFAAMLNSMHNNADQAEYKATNPTIAVEYGATNTAEYGATVEDKTNKVVGDKAITLEDKTNTSEYQTTIAKNTRFDYETDGIILTPAEGHYHTMIVYKYKPHNQLTIDFLIKSASGIIQLYTGMSLIVYKKLRFRMPANYSRLFSLDPRALPDYFPAPFMPSILPNVYQAAYERLEKMRPEDLDGKIGEFLYTINKEWKLVRLRTDREKEMEQGSYFGNDYRNAELTFMSSISPLNILSYTPDSYFLINENPQWAELRHFHSFVKTELINRYCRETQVLDLAIGKGQDFFRYAKCGVRHLFGCDIDMTALQELIYRKHEFARTRDNNRMSIRILCRDLLLMDPSEIEGYYNVICCHFAFHYFCGSERNIEHLADIISQKLSSGGIFQMTCLDGESVITAMKKLPLKDGKRVWQALPHSIEYSGNLLLEPAGQAIKVAVPFSDQPYSEYLVNIKYISSVMEKRGIKLIEKKSFDTVLDKYREINGEATAYTKLHCWYIFQAK